MKRLLIVLVSLALAAGLFISCGRQQAEENRSSDQGIPMEMASQASGAVPMAENVENAENIEKSGSPEEATEYRLLSNTYVLNDIDLDKLILGSRISGCPGSYQFSFEHPGVPEDMHLSVALRIYSRNSSGDSVLFSYDSDGAWLSDPKDYDPSERTVIVPIDINESLNDKCVLVGAKVFSSGGTAINLMARHGFDGTITEGYESVFAWSEL